MSNLSYDIFYLSNIYFNFFLYKYNRFFHFHMILAALLLNSFIFVFLKLIICTACFLNNWQNFFMQSLPQYTSCLFSLLLNEDIVGIEKPDGICSFTFVVDEFSGLFLHPSIFSIIHSRSA